MDRDAGKDSRAASIELVVARYNERVDWVRNTPGSLAVTIYDKGQDLDASVVPRAKVVALANVGFEAHTYLHHIVERYDSLADVTVFCQGHPFDHASDLHHWLRELVAGRTHVRDFRWLGFIIDTDDARGRRLFVPWSKNYDRRELDLDRFHRELFGTAAPPAVRFYPGAQFAVSARLIRSRPRSFYEQALALSVRFPDAGHCFERLWDAVFGVVGVETSMLGDEMTRYLKPIRRLGLESGKIGEEDLRRR